MKVLKNTKTEKYHEIEVEKQFLFFKWKVKYRIVGNSVFRFKEPNDYKELDVFEAISLINYFKIKT